MKRIKSINGYTIYQSLTARDEENYGCQIGNYNIYQSADIRDFGLSYSTSEWDDIDSLATCVELCEGSNFAVACAMADELSGSTAQDMDLCLEIERRLDAGESADAIRESFITDEDDDFSMDPIDSDDRAARKHWTVAKSARRNAYYYCDCCGCTIGKHQTMHCAESTEGDFMVFCDRCIEKQDFLHPTEPEPTPKQEHRSRASYYVVESDGTYYTKTIDRTEELLGYETYKRAFFRAVAERVAFSDCCDDCLEEIVFDGERVEYVGWQPEMLIEFRSCETNEIVYSNAFPQWDH